jgi:putative glutamine amidotransferase
VSRAAVGVTVGVDEKGLLALRPEYVRAVEAAGGRPVLLAPGRAEDVAAHLEAVDGLLLTGGSDVAPDLYGQEAHPKLGRVVRERDEFELALCREALRRDLPVLAICRGQQVLNVAAGGTLVQDIPSQVEGAAEHNPQGVERWALAHEVAVTAGTRLHEVLGRETVRVNSFHHQSVERVGDGLVVSARAVGDGVVEGIEAPGRRFVVGVQWHPEAYWDREGGTPALFAAFVAAASSPR